MRRFIIGLAILSVPANLWAQNATPSSKQAFLFQPYRFAIVDMGSAYRTALIDQGYTLTEYSQSTASTNPSVKLTDLFGGLAAGHGVLMMASHGSTNGFGAEVYEKTPDGLAARDYAYNQYLVNFVPPTYMYPATSDDGYHIGIRPAGITAWYEAANSIVHLISCYGHTFNTAWDGARCVLGYSPTCYPSPSQSDATTFWNNMSGSQGINNRMVDNAKVGTTLERAGNGATTLTPWVSGVSHRSGTNIPGTLNIWFEFDTPTNQVLNPISTTGIVQLASYTWDSSTKLSATVQSTGEGEGYVKANGTVIASANTNQLLLNGGRDYNLRLTHGHNPAADIHGVTYRGGTVMFKVGSEPDAEPCATSHYEIESSQSTSGPWTSVSSAPAGVGHRSVSVGGVGPIVRVVEVEKDGDRVVHGSARANAASVAELAPTFDAKELSTQYARLKADRLAGVPRRAPMTGEVVVAYVTPSLVDVVGAEIVFFWSLQGSNVTVVSTAGFPTDPGAFRAALKADIVTRVGGGADAILLVGDANDHRQFTGAEYSALWLPANGWETIRQQYLNGGYVDQSSRDAIPTFYTADTEPRGVNMGYVTPYWMSDWPYVDVDDDGLPDVPITRLPFTTVDEVYAYASKLWSTQLREHGARTVGLLAGDVNHSGGQGSDVLAALTTIGGVATGAQLEWLKESDYPSIVERNDAAANLWNEAEPDVVFILATWSNRSWPGGFFDQTVTPPFTMNFLESHSAVVVALSCGGANFAQTEDSDYGRPVGERFLAEWNKGAVAWVGPTVGTWQRANDALAIEFAEELFADTSRPIALSYLIALRRILTDYAEEAEVVQSALSTTVLGDPLVRVTQTAIPTAANGPSIPDHVVLAQNTPNPFNPMTRIGFSLPERQQVSLRVYDVRGRLVRVLADRSFPRGQHSLIWDARDSGSSEVASGMYFYRLAVGDQVLTRKMLLLK